MLIATGHSSVFTCNNFRACHSNEWGGSVSDASLNSTALFNSFTKCSAYAGYALYQLGKISNFAYQNQFIGCLGSSFNSAWTQEEGDSVTKLNNGSYNFCPSDYHHPCYAAAYGPHNQIIFDSYTCNTGPQVFGLACYIDSFLQISSYLCLANNTANAELFLWGGKFQLSCSIFADDIQLKRDKLNCNGDVKFVECFLAHKKEQIARVTYEDCHFQDTSITWLNAKPWGCQRILTKLFTISSSFTQLTRFLILMPSVLSIK